MKLQLPAAAVLATSALCAPQTRAGTTIPMTSGPEPIANAGEWSFQFIPYGWLTAIDGETRVGNLTADTDVSFSDTIDSLDMAFMGSAAASYDNWTFFVDFVYGRFSSQSSGKGIDFSSIRAIVKQYIITPAIAYRVIDEPNHHLNLFAGARISVVDAYLRGLLVQGGSVSNREDKTWIDPIIGVQGATDLSSDWFLTYAASIGGFGVSSDLVWSAFAGAGYRFHENMNVIAGYRGVGVDYDRGNLGLDTTTHGPVLGLDITF